MPRSTEYECSIGKDSRRIIGDHPNAGSISREGADLLRGSICICEIRGPALAVVNVRHGYQGGEAGLPVLLVCYYATKAKARRRQETRLRKYISFSSCDSKRNSKAQRRS